MIKPGFHCYSRAAAAIRGRRGSIPFRAALLGTLILWGLWLSGNGAIMPGGLERKAYNLMQEKMESVRKTRLREGYRPSPADDPGNTGLIGSEWTALTTSLGDREAKRTTTNPEWAAYLVRTMQEAGVKPGDTIAIGASGSFPAFLVASLAACQAMDLRPRLILSLGASSFGANRRDFTILDVFNWVTEPEERSRILKAVSLGGEKDTLFGKPGAEAFYRDYLAEKDVPLFYESDFRQNIDKRVALYCEGAPPALFINTGGAEANLGRSALILKLQPGLNRHIALPAEELQGVIQRLSALEVPVIHLLNVRGLAVANRIPWDDLSRP